MIIKNILNKFKPKIQRINGITGCMYKLNNNLHNPHRPSVLNNNGAYSYYQHGKAHNIVGASYLVPQLDNQYSTEEVYYINGTCIGFINR